MRARVIVGRGRMRTDAEVMDVPRATADSVGCYFSERRGLISMKSSRRRDAKESGREMFHDAEAAAEWMDGTEVFELAPT